jgi:small-conductance mechanosensitive channel
MLSPLAQRLPALMLMLAPHRAKESALEMLNSWGDDTFDFVRHQVPRIVGVLIIAFILTRILKAMTRHLSELSSSQGLPSAVRAQQLRTLSSVIYSVGVFIIMFVAALQVLPLLGINMGPLLASAGIAGVAVGFGAQTLVHDFINGFFILVENQYDIGDVIKVAGVTGAVESITLRRTVLRDGDGAVHNVPSSEIKVVSNLTRDWTQLAMTVAVSYEADTDRVIKLLQEVSDELASDPAYSSNILAKPEVPGIEKINGDVVEYLILVKTKTGAQDNVRRELRRRIKASFQKNQVQPGNPNRVYLMETAKPN